MGGMLGSSKEMKREMGIKKILGANKSVYEVLKAINFGESVNIYEKEGLIIKPSAMCKSLNRC